MSSSLIGIGSNIGDRFANINTAIEILSGKAGISLRKVSRIYETKPQGFADQPDFLNCVVEIECNHSPEELLALLKGIENHMGRRKSTRRWGPRLIDLDILFYDDIIFETDELIIPHPRIPERLFVLTPLLDIAPNLLHPKLKKTIRELHRGIVRSPDQGIKLFGNARIGGTK